MHFDFFTFGGALFWEDVFFYQKWRIQRNCMTKTYRLLDSWDIRRASGSFEICQKAFVSYIESHEILKQEGTMVILLHGYTESKNIFKRLWRKLMLTNATVAALNYPSLFRDSVASAHQLLFFLNHAEDINEVSFVTKGAGNLVLQRLFELPYELQTYREKMRIRNIVEINPVIRGKLWCDFLSQFKVFRMLCGPMLRDMTEKGIKNLPGLPKEVNALRIFSDSKSYKMLLKLLEACRFPLEESKRLKKESVYVKGTTFRTLHNEEILNLAVKFINNGKI